MVSVVGIGCCWLLGAVFVVSAVGKLRSGAALRAFTASVADMKVVPAAAVAPVGIAVPALEAVAAVLLFVPATAVLGCVLALVVLAAFTIGIAVVLRRGTVASCRCFGVTERPFRVRHLVRNGVLVAVALVGAAVNGLPGDGTAPELAAVLLAAAVGIVGAVLITMFDDLVELFAAPTRP